jgi:hypothetical protein
MNLGWKWYGYYPYTVRSKGLSTQMVKIVFEFEHSIYVIICTVFVFGYHSWTSKIQIWSISLFDTSFTIHIRIRFESSAQERKKICICIGSIHLNPISFHRYLWCTLGATVAARIGSGGLEMCTESMPILSLDSIDVTRALRSDRIVSKRA